MTEYPAECEHKIFLDLVSGKPPSFCIYLLSFASYQFSEDAVRHLQIRRSDLCTNTSLKISSLNNHGECSISFRGTLCIARSVFDSVWIFRGLSNMVFK